MTDKPKVIRDMLAQHIVELSDKQYAGRLEKLIESLDEEITALKSANAQLQQQVTELQQYLQDYRLLAAELSGVPTVSELRMIFNVKLEQIASLEAQLAEEKARYDSLYTAAISGVRIEKLKEQRITELEAQLTRKDADLRAMADYCDGYDIINRSELKGMIQEALLSPKDVSQ